MEGLVLLGLAIAVCVFVLPIAAFIRAGNVRQELERLEGNLAELWVQISRLRSQLDTLTPPPGKPEPAATPTSARTPVASMAPPVEAAALRQEPTIPSPPAVPARPSVLPPRSFTPPPLLPVTPGASLSTTAEAEPTPTAEPAGVNPPRLPAPIAPGASLPRPAAGPPAAFDWERFMGAKLFAWLGGFALFLAAAYFVKYSFEHNLIPPEVRVAFGFLLGIGLVTGGVLMKRKDYAVTSHTLCATGVVILYAVTFACRAVYKFPFFGPIPTFLMMTLITAAAFLLAVRMNALVVAILGMLGGFLTPILVSTGQDNPVGLFTYIALLDAGLIAVALVRPWPFLVALAALGTVGMELGWTAKFFSPEKIVTAVVVWLGFDFLFLAGREGARWRRRADGWWRGTSAALPVATMLYALALLSFPAVGERPGWMSLLVLGADLCLLMLACRHREMIRLQLVGGLLANLFVAAWTLRFLTDTRLGWVLGMVLVFALLHSVFPIVRARLDSAEPAASGWAHLFPPLALLLILIPLTKLAAVSIIIWPVILLIDLLAMALAVATLSLLSILAVLAITVFLAAAWILRLPTEPAGLPLMLGVVGLIATVFLFAGLFALRRVSGRLTAQGRALSAAFGELGGQGLSREQMLAQLPALSALLPFLLLVLIATRLALPNPSAVFALALALSVLLLSVARTFRQPVLTTVTLGCVLLLEGVWQSQHFSAAGGGWVPLLWHLGFAAVFLAYPFVSRRQCGDTPWPWATAALSLPAHFALIYRVVKLAWPNPVMGLLPAAAALPLLALLVVVARWFPPGHARRNGVLAWFGGAALFFITLIFPIQFDRQWITLGWALEGAALCWLFHRVPHPGLRLTGVGLLVAACARLALNPAVLSYHPRSTAAIWNWYLYTYGLVAAALFVAAWLLAPPRDRIGTVPAPAWLRSLGTLLGFLLVNIEIADYFTNLGEAALTFQFSGNFARDMSYTIAWAVFALGLMTAGLKKRLRGARYAGLGLLSITLLKLFFHDLAQLSQLYRIGALAVVAVVAILASFLYQKFLAVVDKTDPSAPSTPS